MRQTYRPGSTDRRGVARCPPGGSAGPPTERDGIRRSRRPGRATRRSWLRWSGDDSEQGRSRPAGPRGARRVPDAGRPADRARQRGGLPLRLHRRRRRRYAARPWSARRARPTCRPPCAGPATHGIPVVPRGAGSGLSGGANAIDGCLVLSLERMRAVEIDPATRTAVVEAGALNVEVKQAAAEHGLWYPPDPSSFEICSIGGNVATNAGGLCCVKYGVTTDYVLGPRRRPRRRHARAPRRPAGQGHRGALAGQALRRQRGHARRS